jgi:hypothetical protein
VRDYYAKQEATWIFALNGTPLWLQWSDLDPHIKTKLNMSRVAKGIEIIRDIVGPERCIGLVLSKVVASIREDHSSRIAHPCSIVTVGEFNTAAAEKNPKRGKEIQGLFIRPADGKPHIQVDVVNPDPLLGVCRKANANNGMNISGLLVLESFVGGLRASSCMVWGSALA